jgi:CRP-like cAMP-binding protein
VLSLKTGIKDMRITMYDTLLQLPLFQGLSKNDFTEIIGKTKFHFTKYNDNKLIANQGDVCNKLMFLLNGKIKSLTVDYDNVYSLSETLNGPTVIEPYSLFGMKPCYQATYTTAGNVEMVSISKTAILFELNNYDIFRINYLNILSNRSQITFNRLWNTHIGNTREKIVNFILIRCNRADGEKLLNIKMNDFAHLINDTRINVSRVLNEMQSEGLVELSRKEIYIPELSKLTIDLF